MNAPDVIDLSDPASYGFFTDDRVRLSDTDLVGHVNNVGHVALVETGRIDYIGHLISRAELPFGAIMFARLEIDFRENLYHPARVRIGARTIAIGNTSFRIGVGVFDGDTCVTTSVNVMVHIGANGRSATMPASLREILERELAVIA